MNLEFLRGQADRPRGHALALFETGDGRVFATYLIVPPVQIDMSKYMPPMFAPHMPASALSEISAVPLPPVPEEVADGLPGLERLADLRDDDLVRAGSIDPRQIDRTLMLAAEAGQTYLGLYRDWLNRAPAEPLPPRTEAGTLDVDEVMLSLMSDHDRISEIAKLIGKVRYALETGDRQFLADSVADMERIGRHFPPKYRIADVIAAAQRSGEEGARVAELHVERCYKLAAEDYVEVGRIENEIRRLTSGAS